MGLSYRPEVRLTQNQSKIRVRKTERFVEVGVCRENGGGQDTVLLAEVAQSKQFKLTIAGDM